MARSTGQSPKNRRISLDRAPAGMLLTIHGSGSSVSINKGMSITGKPKQIQTLVII